MAIQTLELLDNPRTDNSCTDNPRTDNPRTDNSRTDNPRTDNSRTDNSCTDNSRNDDPRTDDPRNDNSRNDDPRTELSAAFRAEGSVSAQLSGAFASLREQVAKLRLELREAHAGKADLTARLSALIETLPGGVLVPTVADRSRNAIPRRWRSSAIRCADLTSAQCSRARR